MSKLLTKSSSFSENYCAKVITIEKLIKHPYADRLQLAVVDNKNIITDLKTQIGDVMVLFTLETQLDLNYLAQNNQFRADENLNSDPLCNKSTNPNTEHKAYFAKHCRIKAVRLQKIVSDGYLVNLSTFSYLLSDNEINELKKSVGVEFDTIKDVVLTKKYIPTRLYSTGDGTKNKEGKKAKESKIIENQFRFHTDTSQLAKNLHKVSPDSWIVISKKIHGTSSVISKLLCKKPLTWHEKILKRLIINVVDTHLIYSSRKVIKNPDLNPNVNHYYKTDVWGLHARNIEPLLNKGETIYGEIVGYTQDGAAIQSMNGQAYDYGCNHNESKLYVYRITQTNIDGKVLELSTLQMQKRCELIGLETVPILYSGYAKDKYKDLSLTEHWHENFLKKLEEEYLEKKCTICKNKVWDEGIVLRIEGLEIENLKFKSKNFLLAESAELDQDKIDMETQESLGEEN
jgi:hypothetical protein